jgi:ubiquinone/menaquinone biosynthesis C-methylase UbiE
MNLTDYLQSEQYIEYVRKNFGVRGFDIYEGDTGMYKNPKPDIVLEYLKFLNIKKDHVVLDVGCGLGRLLKELHDAYGCNLYGIDSNPKLIEMAKERVSNFCKELKTSNAEKIKYPDGFFDKIICWGVFELCMQENSLKEMARCLKVGGNLLLTGKSKTYHEDDSEAYAAETSLTKRGIKSNFTDYNKMMEFGKDVGLVPVKKYFFERRGLFEKNEFDVIQKEHFYEWIVIFEKNSSTVNIEGLSKTFSVSHSDTYLSKMT